MHFSTLREFEIKIHVNCLYKKNGWNRGASKANTTLNTALKTFWRSDFSFNSTGEFLGVILVYKSGLTFSLTAKMKKLTWFSENYLRPNWFSLRITSKPESILASNHFEARIDSCFGLKGPPNHLKNEFANEESILA